MRHNWYSEANVAENDDYALKPGITNKCFVKILINGIFIVILAFLIGEKSTKYFLLQKRRPKTQTQDITRNVADLF
jgi:hypothetical protein